MVHTTDFSVLEDDLDVSSSEESEEEISTITTPISCSGITSVDKLCEALDKVHSLPEYWKKHYL